jgi:hypothetical protein
VVYVVGEDVLSLDIAFIDRSWNYIMRNIGLIHCKEGTTGEEVARAIRPALEKHNLIHRIYAYVKDQGSNLKTTAMALSNAVEMETNVLCAALGITQPFSGKCCNLSV